MENLTFADGLLGGQPWLEEQENGPTFFPKPPLAPDEPEVIKNFDPERRPQLNFVLPALSHTDASANPAPPPETPRSRFHDPEALDARWDDTDDGFDYTPEMKAEVYNRVGIAREYGETVDDIVDIYPVLRGQYGHEVLGNYDITEIDLDRHFRDDAKFKNELETAVADIPGRLVEGLISDLIWGKTTPAEENYKRWKADHPEYQGAIPDTRMLEAVRQYHADTTTKLAPLAPQIRLLSDYFAEATGQTAHGFEFSGPDAAAKRDQLFDFMTTLPRDLRKLILIGIADSAKRTGSLDYKGTGVQTYEALGRNWNIVKNAKLNADEFAAEAHLERLRSGKPLYRSPDGRLFDSPRYLRAGPDAKLLSEDERARLTTEAERRLARLGFEREVHYFADNRYDPITVHHTGVAGFLETALYGTASSAGVTGLAMLPGGAFLAMAASASEELTKLRAEHPEIAPSDARLIAAVSGVIQGGMERVQGRWFLGTLPTVEKAMNELANPVITSGLKRTFIRGGITAVGENVVEGAQDLTTPILMNIANALQMDVPGVSAMDILMPWAGQRADVAAGLSLMLIGSLFGINARERRMLNSPEQRQRLLELTGFSPEQISRIEQGGTVEEKLAKAREELTNRNQADISRGAKLYQAELDAANAKHFDPEQTNTLSPVLMMSKQGEATPADIGRHWLKIAEDPETAILGETPTEKDMPTVFKKLAGPIADDVVIEPLSAGGSNYIKFTENTSGGHILLNISDPQAVYINSASAGTFGTEIYQAAFAWAFNNRMRIVGDPNGSLRLGPIRHTTHMFNSALRFRSTRHMLPHPKQGLEGWRTDDSQEATEHNIGLLALREAQLVRENLNWLKDLRYSDGRFYDGNTPIPIETKDRDTYIRNRITAVDSNFAGGTGPTTVGRALVTLAAKEAAERDGLVGTSPKTEALKELRYSQARENDKSDLSPNSSGSKQAEVTDWALSTLKDWRKDISVKIHDSADLIPDENLRQTILKEGGTVEGFYNPADRSIHILADRMNSEADVQRVLRHEGMHWAFANALQKEYRELLAGARAKIPDDKLKELLAKYPKASDSTIVEEYLAYEGQNNPKSTVWVTFAYEAKRLLRKVFGDRVEFTDKDILAFLSKANRRLTDKKAENQPKNSAPERWKTEGSPFGKAQQGGENGLLKFSGSDTAETNGSGDSASVRMLAGQGTGGRGDSAHRQSVGEEWRNAASGFQRLGVTVVFGQNTTGVVPRPNGGLILNLDQHAIAGREAISTRGGFEPGTSARLVFGEELIHAAHLSALKKDWIAAGKLSTFDDFVANENRAVFDDIRNTINSAPTDQKARLKEAVFSAYHAYFTHFSEGIKDVTNVETALADIEKGGKALRFVSEFVREAVQLKRQGAITEEVTASLLERLGNWVRKALQRVRETLPGVFTGEFGQQAQMLATRIEAELNALSGTPPKRANMAISEGPRGGLEFHAKDIDPALRRSADSALLDQERRKSDEEKHRNAWKKSRE